MLCVALRARAVALVGVKDLVVVQTEDALLITTRDGSQDVGKVVGRAEEGWAGRPNLMSEVKAVSVQSAPVGPGAVRFGTDGWRGIIADDFTYDNVRVAARAIAQYVLAEEKTRSRCLHRL